MNFEIRRQGGGTNDEMRSIKYIQIPPSDSILRPLGKLLFSEKITNNFEEFCVVKVAFFVFPSRLRVYGEACLAGINVV